MIKNIGRNRQLIDVHPGRKAGRVRKIIHGSRETAQQVVNSLYEKHYAGLFGWPKESTTTVSMLMDLVIEDYVLNGRKSVDDMERTTKFWKDLIGGKPATFVTGRYLKELAKEWRTVPQEMPGNRAPILLEAGTVNRRISILLRGFQLGLEEDPPLVNKKPIWHPLKENAPRNGFVNWPDFERLRSSQAEWVQVPVTIGHWAGMRLEEILGLLRTQVAFDHQAKEVTIDLRPGETKNGEPRFIILSGDPYDLMASWDTKTSVLYPDCLYFCHKNGGRIKDIRSPWDRTCVAAGLGKWKNPKAKTQSLKGYEGLTFHDLRRTGVRNLRRAGVDPKTIMLIIGHKTTSMFDRYNIIDEEDMRDASKKLCGFIRSKYQNGNSGGQLVGNASACTPPNP
ncbi:MAG: tyrosine-type recombinase/integrase [Nitrospira sp.]|nr:tyrosine-type recombinase/integrase [Nitrospira sp.]